MLAGGAAASSGVGGESGVAVTSDDGGAVLRVAVQGRWDWQLLLAVRATVGKCLAEHPMALIVDLGRADDPDGSSAPWLFMVHRTGRAMQPPVPIVVCVARGSPLESRMRTGGAGWFLPIFPDVPAAHAALAHDVAVPDHVELELPPLPDSPSRARRLVARASHEWGLSSLTQSAELIMSELVANAVRHAGTDMLVTVSRRRSALYLAVRDGSTVLPPRPAGRAGAADGSMPDEHGCGLWLVEQEARAWGSRLTHEGTAKVVWAIVRYGTPVRRSRVGPEPEVSP
jgi:anti-sigma regulatory factor (Ser/Thr protein kinase)